MTYSKLSKKIKSNEKQKTQIYKKGAPLLSYLFSSIGWRTDRIFGWRNLVSCWMPLFNTATTAFLSSLLSLSIIRFSKTNTDAGCKK